MGTTEIASRLGFSLVVYGVGRVLQNDFTKQWLKASVMIAASRVGAGGQYIFGNEVENFEKALADFWGLQHAVAVGNGMDALEIALRCLGISNGDKVLTRSFSAFATTLAILRAGPSLRKSRRFRQVRSVEKRFRPGHSGGFSPSDRCRSIRNRRSGHRRC